ncbi:MAG: hypothetical protein IH593_05540 [Bacteroidales bacterium]|nr:hypothetical protein [Bacteroidales bacterium]
MTLVNYADRLKLSLMAIVILAVDAKPQTVPADLSAEVDSIKTTGEESSHSLLSALGYSSNMLYLGSSISRNNPCGYGSLIYGFKDELNITASAFHLSYHNPFVPLYNFSVNYSHDLNSWFDFSAGLYRYQVTRSLADTLSGSFTYGEATFGVDWRLLYTVISFGGIFSSEDGSYLQVRNSRYFETPEFFKNKVNVSFDPYLNLLVGTLVTEETSALQESPGGTHPKPPWSNGIGTGNSKVTGTTSYTKKFGLMELELGLPVAINAERLTVEAETIYILPFYKDSDYPDIKGFVFLISIYLRIF